MIQNKCRNCSRFRQFYYKGKRGLFESEFGKCVKHVGKLREFKNSCELFEEKDEENLIEFRQKYVLERLSEVIAEANDLLLVLLSDRQERN